MTIRPRELTPILGEPITDGPILGPPIEGPILGGTETAVATLLREQAPEAAVPPQEPKPEPPQPEPEPEPPTAPRYAPEVAIRLLDAARFVLAMVVFLVPVVFDPRTVDAFNLTKLTALWVLTTIAGGLWALSAVLEPPDGRRLKLGFTERQPQISTLLGLTVVVASAATALSPTRVLSFFGLYHRFEGLLSLLLYASFVLLVIVVHRRRPEGLRQIIAAFAGSGVAVAAYVLLQKVGVDISRWQEVGGTTPRLPIGSLGNSVLTGSLLGISAPFVIYAARTARTTGRRASWLLGAGLVAGGLWLTQSRPGALAAVAGAAALVLFTRVKLSPWRKAGLVAAALLVLAIAAIVAPGVVGPRAPSDLTVLRTGEDAARYRVHTWDAAWRMTLERPFLGWGPDSFYGNHARFRSQTEARQQELAITDKPQNIFLGWSTSTGFLGLLAYLAVVALSLLVALGAMRRLERRYRALAACFGAGLVAYLVQGMYSIDVPPLALTGWLCVAGLATLQESAEPVREADSLRRGVHPGWPVYLGVGISVLALVAIGLRPLRADHAAWAAERRAPSGASESTMKLYRKAVSLHPFEAAYKGLQAFYLERAAGEDRFPAQRSLLQAAGLYEEASRLQPGNVYFMLNAARVYERLATTADAKYFAQAERWFERAVSIDDLDPRIHELYSSLLGRWVAKAGSQAPDISRRVQTHTAIARQLRAGLAVR